MVSCSDKLRSPTKRPVGSQAVTKPPPEKTEPTVKTDTSSKQIDEFFGEPKKPNIGMSPGHHDDDEGSDDGVREVPDVESEGEECVEEVDVQCSGVNLESLLQMKMR